MTQAKQFADAVSRIAAERGLPRPAAAAIVERERPDLHRAWREALKGGASAPAPAPAPKAAAPKPARTQPADPMAGEFSRFLGRREIETTTTDETPSMTNKEPTSDAEARRKWDSDPQLRAEFRDDFDRYLAYARACCEGRAKILNGGRSRG